MMNAPATTEVTETIDQITEFLSDDVDQDVWRFELDAITTSRSCSMHSGMRSSIPTWYSTLAVTRTPWRMITSLDGHGAYLSCWTWPLEHTTSRSSRAPGSEGWESGKYDLSVNPTSGSMVLVGGHGLEPNL